MSPVITIRSASSAFTRATRRRKSGARSCMPMCRLRDAQAAERVGQTAQRQVEPLHVDAVLADEHSPRTSSAAGRERSRAARDEQRACPAAACSQPSGAKTTKASASGGPLISAPMASHKRPSR